MALHVTKAQRNLLNELHSGWVFQWTGSRSAPKTLGGLDEPGKAKPGEECKCILIDKYQNRAFCMAVGPDEQTAFDRTMVKAQTTERPLTPAENVVRMAQLERELAEAKAIIAAGGQATEPVRETAADLCAQMEEQGLVPHPGNRKSKEWRDTAYQRLRDHEALDSEPLDEDT